MWCCGPPRDQRTASPCTCSTRPTASMVTNFTPSIASSPTITKLSRASRLVDHSPFRNFASSKGSLQWSLAILRASRLHMQPRHKAKERSSSLAERRFVKARQPGAGASALRGFACVFGALPSFPKTIIAWLSRCCQGFRASSLEAERTNP